VAVYRDERWRPALVAWGLVRGYLAWQDDRQLTLFYHRAGDLVEVFRARGELVSDGIQAIEPSGVLHLDSNRLEQLTRSNGELAIALAEELRDRLGQAYRALALQAFASLRQRVAADLVERMGWAPDRPGEGVRVSAQELAEATGSVREVVARTLRQLRRDGLIGVEPNRVVMLDPARLRREAAALS
jgi:CRP/FNR family transcriptional regulator